MGASIGQTFLLEPAREEYVGEVRVNVRLENYVDWNAEQDGHLADESIRRVDVRMLVDTGAANLFLPRDIVETLGLRLLDRVGVEHTDGRTERLDVAGVVRLSVEGAPRRCVASWGRPAWSRFWVKCR